MYFLGRLPWGFLLLALGILLAIGAIVLAVLEIGGALVAFIFAALALLGGILLLMVQNIREERKKPELPEERPLQVYRQTPCAIDAGTYDRLLHSTKALEDLIKERKWDYDGKAYQEKLKLAAAHAKQQRHRDAFREQCRAMLVLMEAVHRYRGKNEDFKPMW